MTDELGELILAGAHASREVVEGKVIWKDNLPCEPECEPEKGLHVVRSAEIGEIVGFPVRVRRAFDDYPTGTFREPGSLADLADWVERNGDPLPSGSANAIAATIRARLDEMDEWMANRPRIVP